MGVKERYFYGASAAVLAAAIAFGGLWDRQARSGVVPGAPALTDESVQDS